MIVIQLLNSQTRQGLNAIYAGALDRLHASLDLDGDQSRQLENLFASREAEERHLRKQMRTTYTPAQSREARLLWLERKGRRLTPEERRQVRAQLRVSPSQQLQFQAYERKLQAHRAETVARVSELVGAGRSDLVLSALTDFEKR